MQRIIDAENILRHNIQHNRAILSFILFATNYEPKCRLRTMVSKHMGNSNFLSNVELFLHPSNYHVFPRNHLQQELFKSSALPAKQVCKILWPIYLPKFVDGCFAHYYRRISCLAAFIGQRRYIQFLNEGV